MEAKRYNSNGRYSQVVEYNNTLHLCGITARGVEGIKEQTTAVLEKIEGILQQHGSDKEHLLTVTIYLKDMADFAAMNEVYDAWVPAGHEPTRACVEARLADESLLVEIVVSGYLSE